MTRALLLIVLFGTALTARAGEPGPLLWQLQTRSGEVLLLGSVHMLRARDYPLAEAIEAAYERADRVVLELDLGTLDPVQMQLSLRRLGMAKQEDSLESLMGPESWREATAQRRWRRGTLPTTCTNGFRAVRRGCTPPWTPKSRGSSSR